ncbi:MAG: site-specific DNA-methyltransferase [Chloroflexi bacterium]|nr:MAG: site-specific DNA-methyltransferase [Chloroflexota bacterium]
MTTTTPKQRSPRNRTLTISEEDRVRLLPKLLTDLPNRPLISPISGIIHGDCHDWTKILPPSHVDLLFLDPPYNLDKSFNGKKFERQSVEAYTDWLDSTLHSLKRLLKPTASIYICADWFTSLSVFQAASKHFIVRNRITWEREKGRGAKANWKNSSEDIWFCTLSQEYTFNVESVKLRRKVIAPYTLPDGAAKDWDRGTQGNFRDTHPSNIWTDITIPFWSMPENTDHPTQKSEKLLAKIVLASTNPDDFVLDPFLGSGTTSVVSKKLGRSYLGIEIDQEYCLLAAQRLELANTNRTIQGFVDGVFWERNTLAEQLTTPKSSNGNGSRPIVQDLFSDSHE